MQKNFTCKKTLAAVIVIRGNGCGKTKCISRKIFGRMVLTWVICFLQTVDKECSERSVWIWVGKDDKVE